MAEKSNNGALRKWSNRAGALVIWFYVVYINSSLMERWPVPLGLDFAFGQEYRPFRFLAYIAIAAITLRFYGKRSVFYIVFFPLWAAGLVFRFVLRIFGLNVRLFSSAASVRVFVTSIALIVVCYFAIHDSVEPYVVYPAVGLLVFLSLLVVYGVFLWAMRPLAGLCAVMEKMNGHFCKQSPKDQEEIEKATEKGDKKKLRSKLKEEEGWLKAFRWLERAILTPQRVFGLFCLVLAFSVLLIGLNYSVAYWGINKISVEHFNVSTGARGFWDFSYFSLMVMTTSDLSGILPVSSFAKILSASQLLCSVILLSMLVLAFTSSGHADVGTARQSLGAMVDNRQGIYDQIMRSGAIEDAEVEEVDDERENADGDEKARG